MKMHVNVKMIQIINQYILSKMLSYTNIKNNVVPIIYLNVVKVSKKDLIY